MTLEGVRRRANGTGTEPKWNVDRQRWEVRITLPDGRRPTLRHKDKHILEIERDKIIHTAYPSPGDEQTELEQMSDALVAAFLRNPAFLDAIAERLKASLTVTFKRGRQLP